MKIKAMAGTQVVTDLANSPSPDAQAVVECPETSEHRDERLSEPPWTEQDARPIDGEAAIHLPPESGLVQYGLVQG